MPTPIDTILLHEALAYSQHATYRVTVRLCEEKGPETDPASSSEIITVENASTKEKIYLILFFAIFAIISVYAFYTTCKASRERRKAKRELQRKVITAGVDLYVKKRDERVEEAGR